MTDVRHFIDLKDQNAADLRLILDTARRIRDARRGRPNGAQDDHPLLAGRCLAMVFEKPSTRTRLSFEMAMQQAGGHGFILGDSQMGRGETISDTAKVLSRMVDMVMVRANSHAAVVEMAAASDVPVINGLTDRSHPCQLMADVLTMEDHLGALDGKKVAWIGDGNNVLRSLIEASVLFNFSLTVAAPEVYSPDEETMDWAARRGHNIQLVRDAQKAAEGAHVVMTDTWVSMGDEDARERCQALEPFQVNDHVMQAADETAVFMHCLPAHRGEEVTDSVIDGPQSVVWDTAENRLHAQKAIMSWLVGQL